MFGTYMSTKELMTLFFLIMMSFQLLQIFAIVYLSMKLSTGTKLQLKNMAVSGNDNNAK